MTLFLIVAALLLLVALALVLPPLFKSGGELAADRDRQNIDIARERLAELKADMSSGAVTRAQFDEARGELELSLYNDLHHGPEAGVAKRGRWAAVVVSIAVPLLAVGLYIVLGSPLAIGIPGMEIAQKASAEKQLAAIDQMVERLAQRLRVEPDNLQGWVMLGRSYKVLRRFPEAVEALKQAHRLAPGQPDIMLQYADALTMAAGGRLAGEPMRLIKAALALKPDDVTGLWLAGLSEAEQGNYDAAIGYWRRAEPLLADDPTSLEQVRALIVQAQRRAGVDSGEESAGAASPASRGVVRVSVTLAPDFASRVEETDTLFVYAQSLSGPPMPLAVVRNQVKDLPLEVVLNDAMAMTPASRLSDHTRVKITARVSKSANAAPRSGDLIGSAASVDVGSETPVQIVIDGMVP
ncbi:MAG: c-type cytochrome biogenesis protein CcmI [Pseudomonadota bacterium]